MMISLRLLAALCATVVWAESCYADCSSLHALAQQHANDMARRNSLDHAGFMARRGPAGAVAENVAMGCETEACARRMWMQSPPHRANMMLGGCQAVASAVSASGHRYWAMEIGGNSRAGTRRTGVTLTRAARRGSGDGGVVGGISPSMEATRRDWRCPLLAQSGHRTDDAERELAASEAAAGIGKTVR